MDDDTKQKIKQAAKNEVKKQGKKIAQEVAKKFFAAILPYLAPILVFLIGLSMVIGIINIVKDNESSVSTSEENINDDGTVDATGDNFKKFLKWLHTYEGGDSKDGKYYVVQSDGGGGSAVGHGVDIKAHGAELQKAGYSTSIGSKIPIEVVDEIESREVSENINSVKGKTAGLNLKEYQIYALVSRAYNCGISGALDRSYSGGNFNSHCKKSWDQSRDSKFGKKGQVDYKHGLYTSYLSSPTTSNGSYLEGLDNRRHSEWLLFQTGYFDRGVEKYYDEDETLSSNSDTDIKTELKGDNKTRMEKLINRAIEIADDKDYQYYTYSQTNRNGPHSFDCSSFCARLYKKYFGISIPSTTSSYGAQGYLGPVGSVKVQPGDILWRSGHVELVISENVRAGAHTAKYPAQRQISRETGGFTSFVKVYRFIK